MATHVIFLCDHMMASYLTEQQRLLSMRKFKVQFNFLYLNDKKWPALTIKKTPKYYINRTF